MDSLCEIYESGWTGHDLLYVQAQNIEMLWQDFSHKLGDQVLIPLNTYQSQFPEMRVSYNLRSCVLLIPNNNDDKSVRNSLMVSRKLTTRPRYLA